LACGESIDLEWFSGSAEKERTREVKMQLQHHERRSSPLFFPEYSFSNFFYGHTI